MKIFTFAVLLNLIFESHCGQDASPSNIAVSSKTATSISLTWDPARNATNYQVFYKEKDSSTNSAWLNDTISSTTNRIVIGGLQPYTEYSIQVLANNKSELLTVKTDEALPSKPDGLTAHFTSPKNLSISWTILAADKANGIVCGYRYIVYEGNSIIANETTGNTTSHVMVNKLDACREYVIKVAARTGAGFGNYSDFKLGNSCPRITFFRPRVVATVHSLVVMPCDFTGTPKPSVSWILNTDESLKVNHSQRHVLVTTSGLLYKHKSLYSNGSLVIDFVESNDMGRYQCRVQSIVGSATANISLAVTAESTVVRFSLNIHNLTNNSDLISPNSRSFMHPAPSIAKVIRSMYNGKVFYTVENVQATISALPTDKSTLQVDILASFNSSQSQFSVEVDIVSVMIINTQDGRLGPLYVSHLTVQGAPPPPNDLTVTRLRPTYVILQWKTPLHATQYNLDVYSIQYKTHGEKDYRTVKTVKNEGPVIHGLLDGLTAGKQYVVRVQSHRSTATGEEVRGAKKEIETPDPMLSAILLTIVLPIALAILVVLLFCGVLRSKFQKANQGQELAGIRRPTSSNREENPYNLGRLLQEFPTTKWKELNRSDLVVGKELGAGAFGAVYRADLKINDKKIPCAIKMVKPYATEREHRDLFNELNLMAQVGYNCNVISLVGACTTDGPLWVVVKLAENGCLLDFLYKHRVPDYLTEGTDHSYMNVLAGTSKAVEPLGKLQKLQFAHGIAKGMSHLEKLKCVHRDLAARNVLLGKHLNPMVSDFGMSRDIYESGMYEDCKGGKRPVRWMAPEAIEDYTCTCKSDVWSYAVTLWEIETAGTVPYAGIEGSLDILKAVKKGYRLEQPRACEDDVYEVMQACWRVNPLDRPSFLDLTSKIEEMLSRMSEYLELQPIEDEYEEVFSSAYDEVIIDPNDMHAAEVPNDNISITVSEPQSGAVSSNNEPSMDSAL